MQQIVTIISGLLFIIFGSIKFTDIYCYLGLFKKEAIALSIVTSFLLFVIFAKIVRELIIIF